MTSGYRLDAIAPRATRLRHTGYKLLQCLDAPLRCDDKYRRQVLILRHLDYESSALPLSYPGVATFYVQLDKIPETGLEPVTSEL